MISGRWTGMERIERNAARLADELSNEKRMAEKLEKIAEPIRGEIERGAPRSDEAPHMADTFIVSATSSKRRSATVRIGPDVRQGLVALVAIFVEFGTSKMRARPFIRPAWDRAKSGVTRGFTDLMASDIRGIVRRAT